MSSLFDKIITPQEEKYNSLKGRASLCHLCPLALHRARVVFGAGKIEHPTYMFVSNYPSVEDEISHKPFSTPVQIVFLDLLKDLQILDDSYFTTILLCKPIATEKLNHNCINTCITYLMQQVDLLKPKVIVSIGALATDEIFGHLITDETKLIFFSERTKGFILPDLNAHMFSTIEEKLIFLKKQMEG